jgi:hypothetical protein
MQFSDDQIRAIKLIHKEDAVGSAVFRMAFVTPDMIEFFKQKSVKAMGRNAYSIQLDSQQLKFIILDNRRERFKLRNVAKDNSMRDLVIMIKNDIHGDIYDMVSKIDELNVPVKYISHSTTATFVGFASKGQARCVKNKLLDDGLTVRFSLTFIYLEKYALPDAPSNNNNHINPASVPLIQPPLVRFPSFNINPTNSAAVINNPNASNNNPMLNNNYMDLRQQLDDSRMAIQRNNIMRGLANQTLTIPGSLVAEMFDLQISFIPKRANYN